MNSLQMSSGFKRWDPMEHFVDEVDTETLGELMSSEVERMVTELSEEVVGYFT